MSPGPWLMGLPCFGEGLAVIDNKGGEVCCLGKDGDEHDAPLLAAAPDLLAACEAAELFFDDLDPGERIFLTKILRPAIAKAKGAT
jgi:hypothetical protein